MAENRINDAVLACKEEQLLDFSAQIIVGTDRVKIQTEMSRDHRRSNNGGEYYFWESIWPNEEGEALMQRFSSCDFWEPEPEPVLLGMMYSQAVELVRKCATAAGILIELRFP